ncbi:MAG TPA: dUTP diphosphatase [Candidatus Magasanikbacteria bacterium]|jgi:dUTP pyrophosphatase|nr:dUTP diphosphatase [Candidatus Magasanikbacteria bacterium]HQF57253.1 dUTP diphosphatase [Candidatus Magasanikbacteria bacterium]HQL52618.1 dUTP diphosphatase [Candidatus Magasanikbacteria bacterium]
MKVKIKRIDKNLPLPEYHTDGAVAFDLYSRISINIKPKTLERLPTNIIVETPTGFMLEIKDRSSTLKKKGLLVTTGYIDNDFCGENDEILLQVYNITDTEVKIEKGERLGQGVFIKIDTAEWEEVEKMENKNRGGFGSTG